MVEQSRQASHAVSVQAGPGDVDSLIDVNLRISSRSTRAFGRRLAAIGDQLDREWAGRQPARLPTPLHLLRPAQVLTRTLYWDIHSQLWGCQGLSAVVKAWTASTAPGRGILRAVGWGSWVSSFRPLTCTDCTRGALLTAALVAAAVLAWVEWGA